jgi:hypothetical protein
MPCYQCVKIVLLFTEPGSLLLQITGLCRVYFNVTVNVYVHVFNSFRIKREVLRLVAMELI